MHQFAISNRTRSERKSTWNFWEIHRSARVSEFDPRRACQSKCTRTRTHYLGTRHWNNCTIAMHEGCYVECMYIHTHNTHTHTLSLGWIDRRMVWLFGLLSGRRCSIRVFKQMTLSLMNNNQLFRKLLFSSSLPSQFCVFFHSSSCSILCLPLKISHLTKITNLMNIL